jgi:hypothetical protein
MVVCGSDLLVKGENDHSAPREPVGHVKMADRKKQSS